jgi:membrane protein implicated in regulation of membrane protease activity
MTVKPFLLDAAPALAAVTVPEIPEVDPYIQVFVLLISAITAVVRFWKSVKKDKQNKNL